VPLQYLTVVVEIFGHLSPADLLSLGRLNKDFRRVLVTRKPWFLWKTALGSCDAPPCPEDMSPPAWSHLLFGGTYCYVSNSSSLKWLSVISILPGAELRRTASNEDFVFSASSCMQILLEISVNSTTSLPHTISILTDPSSLYCSSKVPKEYRDMIRFYAG
jgi:hypothetical protein